MNKLLIILIVFLSIISVASSQQIRIEDNNRVVVVDMVKGSVVTFLFYGDSYSIELGSFDFDHNRATVEMHPQLGTDIVNLNTITQWDLDVDGEDDIGVTIVSLDPNQGSSLNGEPGTARIRLESLKPISAEPTTVTTAVATSIQTTTVAGAAVADSSSGGFGGTTTWIIAGIVVGVLVIGFLLKDKIMGMFGGAGGAAASGQQMPSNYKPAAGKAGGGGRCSKCGKELQSGARFCNNCGAKTVEKKRFCPECGTEYKGGKFCQNCGHKMV